MRYKTLLAFLAFPVILSGCAADRGRPGRAGSDWREALDGIPQAVAIGKTNVPTGDREHDRAQAGMFLPSPWHSGTAARLLVKATGAENDK